MCVLPTINTSSTFDLTKSTRYKDTHMYTNKVNCTISCFTLYMSYASLVIDGSVANKLFPTQIRG